MARKSRAVAGRVRVPSGRGWVRRLLLVVSIGVVLAALGCGPGAVRSRSYAAAPPAPSGTVTKLLVVVDENHSLGQVRRGMPYEWWLARSFGYSTRYRAVSYPSLPNYLAMISGHTHGLTADVGPAAHPMTGPTVFGRALAAGKTAAVYAGGMSRPCRTQPDRAAGYGLAANAWVYFPAEHRQCVAHDLPLPRLWPAVQQGRLPVIGMVRPNKCNDGHSCPLATADRWLARAMARIFAGPDWRSGHLAVVLTSDEDNTHAGNHVLTVVVHPSQHHHVVRAPLNHYSIAQLYAQVSGTTPLKDARTAPSLAQSFGLPLPH